MDQLDPLDFGVIHLKQLVSPLLINEQVGEQQQYELHLVLDHLPKHFVSLVDITLLGHNGHQVLNPLQESQHSIQFVDLLPIDLRLGEDDQG